MNFRIYILIFTCVCNTTFGQAYNNPHIYTFDVHYYQKKARVSSDEFITLTTTGNLWKYDSKQVEAIWNYHTEAETQSLFTGQKTIGWLKTDSSGAISKETRVWIHPPRNN
jgi:hypothetical protein